MLCKAIREAIRVDSLLGVGGRIDLVLSGLTDCVRRNGWMEAVNAGWKTT